MFAAAFLAWAKTALPSLAGEQICVNGKTRRGSRGKEAAAQARLVLVQQAVEGKSNEIMAIPEVLALLDLRGALKNHGRIEVRRTMLSTTVDWLSQQPEWAGLQAVGRVESLRSVGTKTTTDYRYYLTSLLNLERFTSGVRDHWAIENAQHWVLDVQFGEDANRSRKDHSPANLALLRRMALNVVRPNGAPKHSLRLRKLKAALNDDYRYSLIFGAPPS